MASSDSELKEVRFDKYCSKCKYWESGREDGQAKVAPCDDCLEKPIRTGTEVPIRWEKP